MATQIFDSNDSVLLPGQAQAGADVKRVERVHDGGAFRGLFFAILFNVFLFLIGAGAWELWRIMR